MTPLKRFASLVAPPTISFLIFAVIAEFGLTWWVHHHGDALQRARLVLEPDARIGWHQRGDLSTSFEGHPLHTDEIGLRIADDGSHYTKSDILVLGPSSAFGWGVANGETWSAQVEKILSQEGAPVSVVNSSQIGFSLHQGIRLYDEQLSTRYPSARVIVIAFGVNDIDRFRFFGTDPTSDEDYFSTSHDVALEALANHWAFTGIVLRAWQESRVFRQCGLTNSPHLRSEPETFKQLLRKFVLRLRAEGKRVVLVNSARHFPIQPNPLKARLAEDLYGESVSAAQSGACARSRALLQEANQNEPWRVLRDIDRINVAMNEVAKELDTPLADLASALNDPTGAGGNAMGRLFVDPIHFSPEGHLLAAKVIATQIKQGLQP